jgi:hypothetical protein
VSATPKTEPFLMGFKDVTRYFKINSAVGALKLIVNAHPGMLDGSMDEVRLALHRRVPALQELTAEMTGDDTPLEPGELMSLLLDDQFTDDCERHGFDQVLYRLFERVKAAA